MVLAIHDARIWYFPAAFLKPDRGDSAYTFKRQAEIYSRQKTKSNLMSVRLRGGNR
jgi:hypothetical protein